MMTKPHLGAVVTGTMLGVLIFAGIGSLVGDEGLVGGSSPWLVDELS